MSSTSLWGRFQEYFLRYEDIGFELDISRMRFPEDFFKRMEPKILAAYRGMAGLEAGEIANPDENRMAGHYWLRAPQLAPTTELREEIERTNTRILEFAGAVHGGKIVAGNGKPFTDVLLIGIGGSALGPQFVADALGSKGDAMRVHFLDNTDPDGFDAMFDRLGASLAQTLVIVISKSGGTKETRNGMIETEKRCATLGLDFPKQAVAVTGEGSDLDKLAAGAGWLARFPMWDWVGGRTSIMSAVGLLPMALQGIDTKAFLAGAAAMDVKTRQQETGINAAMLLALMWHYAGNGQGAKDMVILPYKDRLVLFSRYLQQLVMESLGKERDLDGKKVNQGIAVYGNKGSTDQHAYVQQLREGVANFFVTFIDVAKNRVKGRVEVEPGITSGDYLEGFLRGTRAALYENGRDSITVTLAEVTPFMVGALIAVYDRAVGFYGGLVHVNAYHQPGVEAGKKAATRVLELQKKIQALLKAKGKGEWSADGVAAEAGEDAEEVYHALSHLAANSPEIERKPGANPGEDRFLTR